MYRYDISYVYLRIRNNMEYTVRVKKKKKKLIGNNNKLNNNKYVLIRAYMYKCTGVKKVKKVKKTDEYIPGERIRRVV